MALSFYSTCYSIPQAPSAVHAVPLQFLSHICLDQKHMRLTSSTKDRKKGCAYDPGALKVRNTRLLINIHEPFFVFLFSVQQDATETW